MLGSSIDEVEKASTAVELGQEKSGIGLGFRGLDPLNAGSDFALVTAPFAKDPTPIAAAPHDYPTHSIITLIDKRLAPREYQRLAHTEQYGNEQAGEACIY